ncbi:hypothetical protein [uncultured Arthrobacter sp.]|uniref:hypothetical protein n=1 Tax=uncultured Arthrobacter sp. TaxID=114050 RepID=UPI0026159C14|nr:hypothetical protein [uncultured Arthrobacter sp.]
MGENTPNIDNRYSPIYQRGGTGAPHASPGSRWTAPEEPPHRRQGTSPEPQPPRPAEEQANVVEVMPQEAAPDADTATPAGRFNPFVLILWLLGAALLALGLWAVFAPLQVDETAINGPFPQWIYIISQSAGGMVVGGSIFLAAGAWLSAVSWERRHRIPPQDPVRRSS